ncbi:ATP-binding cassette, subfamily C [Fontibacillus panacisegetis]|uniref:ATP-binding cassette, subfamily C n=1 Tax=Fontibacillus panacisegetis TaxID=670482 RepID=A0A1G7K8C4_9BACL|nr:ABC transporter ATP-binding protein [Fontibacillus panacisegetis]SDF33558.1 ATP-binding cassette, subfamily C [Fontibacillus panacisegetis]
MNKLKHKKSIKSLLFLLSTIKKNSAFIFVVIFLVTLTDSMLQFIPILFPQLIIDELLGEGKVPLLIKYVLGAALLSIVLHVAKSGLNYYIETRAIKINKDFNVVIGNKTMKMDYEYTENPNILDKKEKADQSFAVSGGMPSIINNMIGIVTSLMTIIGLSYIISSLNGFIIIIILFIILLNSLLQKKIKHIQYTYWNKLVPINREYSYFFRTILDFNFGKDIRLYNMKNLLLKKSKENIEKNKKNMTEQTNKKSKLTALIELIILVQQVGIYGFMVFKVINLSISIGAFTMYVSAIYKLSQNISTLIGYIIDLNQSLIYINSYVEFINLPSEKSRNNNKTTHSDQYEIKFDNVSFKYPNDEKYTLKNINMIIRHGQRLSIVGANGAGKTTLIKLMTRMYEPTEGGIFLNGTNIKDYDYEEYLTLFSVVFQDFRFLATSIKANVTIGRENEKNVEIFNVLDKTGILDKVRKMPYELETSLYKLFDSEGIELSGGELQKLAIARALYKNAPIVILDEPTAALDPISEYDIYTRFNDLTENKTTIYISHRLSSCRICDLIAVFKNGHLVELGDHDELMKNQFGDYKKMFDTQAEYYVAPDRNKGVTVP